MKKTTCAICKNNAVPINESVKIDGKVHCNTCYEATFPDKEVLNDKVVETELDPTICAFCHKDFGTIVLNKLSFYPICDECSENIKKKTFPNWVKIFLLGILALVIFSFSWNWRFFSAYRNIKKSFISAAIGDYKNAFLSMDNASKNVPEAEDLKSLSIYYHGTVLLSEDKGTEALDEFNKCKDKIPADYNIDFLILSARVDSAFENKDYEKFVSYCKESLSMDSSAYSVAGLASAYSCLYASKGNEEAKQNAIKYLNKARKLDDTSEDIKKYYNMIEYRLATRDIIKREDFFKKYPKGWTKN